MMETAETFDKMNPEQLKDAARKLGPRSVFRLFEALDMHSKDQFETLHTYHLETQPRWVRRRVGNNRTSTPKTKHDTHRDAVYAHLHNTPYLYYTLARNLELIEPMSSATFRDCIIKPMAEELGLAKSGHKIGREVLYTLPGFDPYTLPEVRPKPFDLKGYPNLAAAFIVAHADPKEGSTTLHTTPEHIDTLSVVKANSDLFPNWQRLYTGTFVQKFIAPYYEEVMEFSSAGKTIPLSPVAMHKNPEKLEHIKAFAHEEFKNQSMELVA